MCIESDYFYGTNGSSFSELIYQKRYYDKKLSMDEFNIAIQKDRLIQIYHTLITVLTNVLLFYK